MSQPFDPDEPEADDPFERQTAGGYRVGARLEAAREGRGRPWWLGGVAIAAIVGIAAIGPRGGPVPSDEPPASTATAREAIAALGTALPALQDFGWTGPQPRAFPVYAGGVRWLEPGSGTLSGNSFDAPRGWTFVAEDGSVTCACHDSPWSETAAVEQIDLIRWDASGRLELRHDGLLRLESTFRSGASVARDVALTSDGSTMYLVSAVRKQGFWDLGLSWTDVDGLATGSVHLGELPEPEGQHSLVVPIVRVSPGGETLQASIRWRKVAGNDPEDGTWRERVWRMDVRPGAALSPVAIGSDRPTDVPDRCSGEGWVTDRDYALLCQSQSGDATLPIVRIEDETGQTLPVQVDPPVTDDVDWLVDTTGGVIFRWSPFSHLLARVSVGDRTEISRSLGSTADEIAAAVPQRARSTVAPHPVRWTRFGDAQGADAGPRLVGSADGTVLWAIGARAVDPDISGGPDTASTGVWAFDPSDLSLIGHWRAAAMYQQIVPTPDGHALVAIGAPGSDAEGRPTSWGPSIVFHDLADGHVARIVGDSGSDGFTPILLLPGGP